MLVAPMSGHYATLLRSTVKSLIVDCEVYITDWHNARDIPVSQGKFDIEDYTLYLVDFMRHLGPDTHVIAICQPAPLTLAATAYLAEEDPKAQPRTLTLIGFPVGGPPDISRNEISPAPGVAATATRIPLMICSSRRMPAWPGLSEMEICPY